MDIKARLFSLYPEEITARCNATTIAPRVSFIEAGIIQFVLKAEKLNCTFLLILNTCYAFKK
jgi:hypothetical protein